MWNIIIIIKNFMFGIIFLLTIHKVLNKSSKEVHHIRDDVI